MYSTCMTGSRGIEATDQDVLARLDTALLSLRRLTSAPPPATGLRRGYPEAEVSTMLVVDTLARHTHSRQGLSVAEVAESLRVTPSTASRLVERADIAGMVTRAPSTVDPRRAALTLTPAGRALHRRAVTFRTARLAEFVSTWSARDLATFTRLLERFATDTTRTTTGDTP